MKIMKSDSVVVARTESKRVRACGKKLQEQIVKNGKFNSTPLRCIRAGSPNSSPTQINVTAWRRTRKRCEPGTKMKRRLLGANYLPQPGRRSDDHKVRLSTLVWVGRFG